MNSTQAMRFNRALARLESSLDVPVIPGELGPWLKSAEQGLRELEREANEELSEHRDVYKSITQADATMAHRVRQLQREDQRLHQEIKDLEEYVARHRPRAEIAEPREELETPAVERICELGLALVRDLRKQEVALATWLQEAYQRDRGVAD